MIRLVILLLALAGGAAAQDLKRPALYDVSGVAGNDVLNLRAEPSGGAQVVGALAHDARDVEIVAVDDTAKWGLVALPEGSGWASLRFLTRLGGQDDTARPPLPLACGGTEPFWSMTLTARDATLRIMDQPTHVAPLRWTGPPVGMIALAYGMTGGDLHGVIERRACSDGMSDRPFGLSIMAIVDGAGGPTLYSGCCSLR